MEAMMEKETPKVELKVNVINQLILYRNSTFKDKLCFIDENVQNAQRAKATKVKVDYSADEKWVKFTDDGKGLDDPQKLFSMAESGWDRETMENENPFGLGFFSNISVSDMIEIRSRKFHILFDVQKVISEKDTTAIAVTELEEEFEGFELTLRNFDFKAIYNFEMKERVERLGKYVQELDVYFCGSKSQKADLVAGDGNPDNIAIDDGELQGWFRFSDDWGSKLSIYYKGRFIKHLEISGVLGDIHISDKTLNLTAPDRKDVINDEKYKEFQALLRMYFQEACLNIIQTKSQKHIDKISTALKYYAHGEMFFNSLEFMMIEKKEDFEFMDELIKVKKKYSYLNTFSELEGYLKKEEATPKEIHDGFVEVEKMQSESFFSKGRFEGHEGHYVGGSSGYYSEGKRVPELDEAFKEYEYKRGADILALKRFKFWIDVSELVSYEEQVSLAEYYHITLVICKNSIESKLWKEQETAGNVFHISKLVDKVKIVSEIFNLDLNTREQRAAMIFAMISRMAGYPETVFVIGDVIAKRRLELEELNLVDEVRMPQIVFVANKEAKKVYIDRSVIRSSKLRSDLSVIIALNDYKFVLKNIVDMCDAMGILLKKDKHALMNDLIRALADNPWF